MNHYTVEMTPTAERELQNAFSYIHAQAPLNAVRWLKGIHKAIDSLEDFPSRCAVAPESAHLGETLRHYIFKSHRVIFFRGRICQNSADTLRQTWKNEGHRRTRWRRVNLFAVES